MRRNLVAHGMVPPANYFLLALPDEMYLWSDSVTPKEIPPDLTIPTREALGKYAVRLDFGGLSERSLELVLTSWLSDLTHFGTHEPAVGMEDWLSRTGLADAIFNGSVETSAAA